MNKCTIQIGGTYRLINGADGRPLQFNSYKEAEHYIAKLREGQTQFGITQTYNILPPTQVRSFKK